MIQIKRLQLCAAGLVVFATVTVSGCGSAEPTGLNVQPNRVVANYTPTIDQGAAKATEGLSSEREKILQQQLELEREKAALEKQRLQHQLELEKFKAEQAQERIQAQHDAVQAQQFTDAEFADLRRKIIDNGNYLGRSLLSDTHPLGKFTEADSAAALSGNRQVVTGEVTVNWKGGWSDSPYVTVYSFRITKQGFDRLEVEQDSSIIFKIDPKNLRTAQQSLREFFQN